MTIPFYRQTHTTAAGQTTVTRQTEDSPVVVEQGGTTITLATEGDEAMTVTASIAAAAIFHQFPQEAREAFNPANLPGAAG